MPVLLDRAGARDGQLHGRSPHMQAIHVNASSSRIGEIVPVVVETAKPLSLTGRILSPTIEREVA